MTAPRPLVDALMQQTAAAEGRSTAELRRRQPKRVSAIHSIGTALDNLDVYDDLAMHLRAAISEYLTKPGDDQ